MEIRDLTRCRIEARGIAPQQRFVYDEDKGSYTSEPQRDERGNAIFSLPVDVISDCEPSMITEYLTIHAAAAPVLDVTEMHQQLVADNLRLELWRSSKRAGYGWHCDGVRVASKGAKGSE